MKSSNTRAIVDAPGFQDAASVAISADMVNRASMQVVATGSNAAGTVVLQVSNDAVFPPNAPTNWSTIGSTITVSGPGTQLIPATNISYEWMRASFTSSEPGEQTITTVADATAMMQADQIDCLADNTSVPGVYAVSLITFPTKAGATAGDYVIFYKYTGQAFAAALNVSGTDPEPTGALWLSVGATQRVNVDISGAVTDDDVANLVATAIGALPQMDMTIGTVASGGFTVTQIVTAPQTPNINKNANDSGNGSIVASAPSPQGAFPVSSLNSTYFLLYDANDANTYYVWFDVAGFGVDPAPGGIGIKVSVPANETADNVATACTGPISAVSSGVPFNANAFTNLLLVYNQANGPSTIPTDGTAATGFTFAINVIGVNPGFSLNNTYFLCSDANDADLYQVWFNVSSLGTPPAVEPGYTLEAVAITAGDSANAVATALAGVLAGLPGFASGVLSANIVDLANLSAGPFTPAFDSTLAPTTFTFALSGTTNGTINVNIKTLGF